MGFFHRWFAVSDHYRFAVIPPKNPGPFDKLKVGGAGTSNSAIPKAVKWLTPFYETEASKWTQQDTPIFVGARTSIRSALAALDGASVHATAG